MERKWILLIVCAMAVVALFALTGFGRTPQMTIQTQAQAQEISSRQAREIAVDFVGYGVAHDVMAFTDAGVLTFEVDVRHDEMRYVVLINAESGNVIRLSRYNDETAVAQATSEPPSNLGAMPDNPPQPTASPSVSNQGSSPSASNQVSSPPVSSQGSSPSVSNQVSSPPVSSLGSRLLNPAISLDRAIEIAYADLASRGINATYRSNSGMDWERGQWVWELLFWTHGERMPLIEYYINADNGNIVKFEWDD